MRNQLKKKLGSAIRAQRKTDRLARHIQDIPTSNLVEKGFVASATDQKRIEAAIGLILRHLLKTDSLPEFRFEAHRYGRGVRVATDLPFDSLNVAFHKLVDPKHSTLTAPYLLSHYINAQEDSYHASRYNAEIASDPLFQKLARLDISRAVSSRAKSEREIAFFCDYNFDESRDVRTAINSGERTVEELIPVLSEGRKFRQWAGTLDENACLMKEYYRAISKPSWLDKLPAKTVRWSMFTGAGLAIDSLGAGGGRHAWWHVALCARRILAG